jgi:hypothetical protein
MRSRSAARHEDLKIQPHPKIGQISRAFYRSIADRSSWLWTCETDRRRSAIGPSVRPRWLGPFLRLSFSVLRSFTNISVSKIRRRSGSVHLQHNLSPERHFLGDCLLASHETGTPLRPQNSIGCPQTSAGILFNFVQSRTCGVISREKSHVCKQRAPLWSGTCGMSGMADERHISPILCAIWSGGVSALMMKLRSTFGFPRAAIH